MFCCWRPAACHFRDRYVGRVAARGCGGGGVNGLSSNSVCIAKGFIHKAYTLQRYSDKESQILIQLDKSLKVSEPQRKGMHSLYEPVHEIWTYRISTTASNNRLFWRV